MRTELVGREAELGVLLECLQSAQRGRPRVALCEGEAGIGKTRLALELVERAGERGVLTAWGHATDALGAPPYWPWVGLMRTLTEEVDLAAFARRRGLEAELADLVPGLHPPVGSPEGSPEDRFRQFDAVTRTLQAVSRQRPLLLVLEDLHWADKPSLLLLQHLTRSLTGDRILVVVTARTTERRHGGLLATLRREPTVVALPLRGLPGSAVREQLRLVVGQDVGEDLVARIGSLTGGNPFFVGEVGRALADAGRGQPFVPATATVREAIRDRVSRLGADTVLVLRAAAVVGPEFSVSVVAAMTGRPGPSVLDLLAAAVDAGLVERRGPDRFGFVHALVSDALEADLGPQEAVELHRLAAGVIEQQGPAGAELFDLARHRTAAVVDRVSALLAAEASARAGEEALVRLAYEDAARLLRQAVELGGSDLGAERRCRLLLSAGRALNLAGDLGARLEVCLDAAALARELGRPDLLAEAALVMEAVATIGFDLATRRLCQEALAALAPDQLALRAKLTARYVETYVYLRHGEAVAAASQQALELAEQSGDPRALGMALRARQVVCTGPDGLEEREELARRLLALGTSLQDPRTQMWAWLWLVDVALERGDLTAVGDRIEQIALFAQQVRGPFARFEVARCRAVLAAAQARFDDARRLEAEAFAALAPTGQPLCYAFRAAFTTTVGHHVGYDDAALAAAQYEGSPEGLREELGFIAEVALAEAMVVAGRLDEAAARYRALGPVRRWDPPPPVVLLGYALGIRAAAALGESEDVAVLRERLSPYRGHHVVSGLSAMAYLGPVELWLGIGAEHLGLLDDAIDDFEQAARVATASGAVAFRVEAEQCLAETLLRRNAPGDLDRARSLVARAEEQAGVLGLVAVQAGLQRARSTMSGADPLTAREREVAGLVARGCTNREIARRLVISERTAENHVQHILTKLDLANRSQLAVWAADRMSIAAE